MRSLPSRISLLRPNDEAVATSTVLLAAGIGLIVGWIAHTLVTEPDRPERERQLVDAYSEGWRACESYLIRRAEGEEIMNKERRTSVE